MFRHVIENMRRSTPRHVSRRNKHSSGKSPASRDEVAYEIEYYYKQDKKLLRAVKQKTEDEVKHLQHEIQVMRNKIDEYNRNINENLRFLRSLESNQPPAKDKKN
ncbi:uncharacterized protein LOC105190674 [Harpegnathos saltator]|uniref:Uncharacterized protein n=1 Tax=Harpegnathos saltator TaxID=610380 RepID=E2C711_HARSA|nr:uncharacterized protein LOC105190674 [Harpegnathos saltator]EFN76283.1 hypothetical protein EAI_15160 [Harpegnathos saltator]